jgi:hypothetical protein
MFSTGRQSGIGLFSRDIVGTLVVDYVHTARQLSDRRWDLITGLCGKVREKRVLSMHAVQVNRRTLYEPSSPVKASDDE